MDVIDRLNLYGEIAKKCGIEIRYVDLRGAESGLCEINRRQVLFLDLALSSSEQLEFLQEIIEAQTAGSARKKISA